MNLTRLNLETALENIENMESPLHVLVKTLTQEKGNSPEIRALRADACYISAGIKELKAKLHQHLADMARTVADEMRSKASCWADSAKEGTVIGGEEDKTP
jgi:hypothetical protein